MATVPYIMPSELLAESAGAIDFTTLYPTSPLSMEQKLAKLCREVSDTIDDICGKYVYSARKKYTLRASEDTESAISTERMQAMLNSRGELLFIANYRPIITVTSFLWAPVTVPVISMEPVDLELVSVEGRDIIATGMWEVFRYSDLRITVTYVNGFPNTLLSSNVAGGADTLVVDDITGFRVGDDVEIMDDLGEGLTVSAIDTTTRTLTFNETLVGPHAAGVRITEIPRSVHRAAIYLAWDVAQSHARQGLAIAKLGLMGGEEIERPINFKKEAMDRLQPYILTP